MSKRWFETKKKNYFSAGFLGKGRSYVLNVVWGGRSYV